MKLNFKYRGFDLLIIGGIVLVLLGFVIAGIILYNYYVWSNGQINFRGSKENPVSFSDLATVLAGTSGLLFSLAGIFFFTYTLYQAKKEMNETQGLLASQIKESYFHNLLKNHKEMVNAIPDNIPLTNSVFETFNRELGFKEKVRIIIDELELYGIAIKNNNFSSFHQTQNNPVRLYNRYFEVKQVGKSLLHIINFIKREFKNEEHYHTTLQLSLCPEESFLIGLIIKNKLEPFERINSEYCSYYEEKALNFKGEENKSIPSLIRKPLPANFICFTDDPENKEFQDRMRKATFLKVEGLTENYNLTSVVCEAEYFNENERRKTREIVESELKNDSQISLFELYKGGLHSLFKHSDQLELYLTFYYENKIDFNDYFSVQQDGIVVRKEYKNTSSDLLLNGRINIEKRKKKVEMVYHFRIIEPI